MPYRLTAAATAHGHGTTIDGVGRCSEAHGGSPEHGRTEDNDFASKREGRARAKDGDAERLSEAPAREHQGKRYLSMQFVVASV